MRDARTSTLTSDTYYMEIVLKLSKADKTHIAAVRCHHDLIVAETGDAIWIRGISSADYLSSPAKLLPAINTFTLDKDDHLFLAGSITPITKIQKLEWVKIAEYCNVEMPTAAIPAKVETTYQVKIVPSDNSRNTGALITTLDQLKLYAESAAEVRLKSFRFAVSENETTILIGDPIPPIEGKEYWIEHNILLPVGFDFEIPFVSKLVLDKVNSKNHLLIFNEDTNYEMISSDQFVEGSRSAIRLTRGKINE
jgi:hypothetical protein